MRLERLRKWIRKHVLRKEETKYYAEVKGWPDEWEEQKQGVYVPKPGQQATRKDYGKFFKGKGRKPLPHYRRAVKKKVQPNDET